MPPQTSRPVASQRVDGQAGMTALKPNVVIYLIDDMDLERVPFYPRLDKGAAAQLEVHRRGNACRKGLANCTYTAPNIESIGERGVRPSAGSCPQTVTSSLASPRRWSVAALSAPLARAFSPITCHPAK